MSARSADKTDTTSPLRTMLALLAVGSIIALIATTILFALSAPHITRSPLELSVPLFIATVTTALVLVVGGFPYYAGRDKAPWPILWFSSIACILVITFIVVFIATITGAHDGTGGISALVLMVPVCFYAATAIAATELLLRKMLASR